MVEKPDLADELILACARDRYGLLAVSVEFLPVGNDSTAWVYRLSTEEGFFFLKIKKGSLNLASLLVPRHLQDGGLDRVVAPVPTAAKDLWSEVGDFKLILYPFIDGMDGMTLGLSDSQWVEYGAIVRRIHSIQLSPELRPHLRRETFIPKWSPVLGQIERRIASGRLNDSHERELAAFWVAHQDAIQAIAARAEALGRALQRRSPAFVLCHADIHTANLLVDPQGRLFVVDWDEVLLAPRERDLMFIVGGAVGRAQVGATHEALFFADAGYGATQIDPLALAYYRYEWVVQDMGDYGERVFLAHGVGDETRRDAVGGFVQLFQPGNVLDAAYAADKYLSGSVK